MYITKAFTSKSICNHLHITIIHKCYFYNWNITLKYWFICKINICFRCSNFLSKWHPSLCTVTDKLWHNITYGNREAENTTKLSFRNLWPYYWFYWLILICNTINIASYSLPILFKFVWYCWVTLTVMTVMMNPFI